MHMAYIKLSEDPNLLKSMMRMTFGERMRMMTFGVRRTTVKSNFS